MLNVLLQFIIENEIPANSECNTILWNSNYQETTLKHKIETNAIETLVTWLSCVCGVTVWEGGKVCGLG
jgi:hypothetical protein